MRGVLAWLFQRATGVMLLAGMVVHFWIMHYSGSGQIAYEAVRERFLNPWWKAFDAALLLSVIYHGFAGLWGIAIEYAGQGALLRLSQVVIGLSAAGLTGVGIYILWG